MRAFSQVEIAIARISRSLYRPPCHRPDLGKPTETGIDRIAMVKLCFVLSTSRRTSFSKIDKRCNDKLQPMRLLLRSISVIKLRYKASNHRRTVIFLPRGHVRGFPLKICNAIFPLSSERMKGDSRKLLNLKLFFLADKTSVIFSETISLEYRER